MTVTLIDGRTYDLDNAVFDRVYYRFHDYNTGEDLTNLIFQRDKAANWSGFDRSRDNERAYVENFMRTHGGQLPPETGSTSFWNNFFRQIYREPFNAPIQAVESALAAAGEQLNNSPHVKSVVDTLKILAALAAIAALVYVVKSAKSVTP